MQFRDATRADLDALLAIEAEVFETDRLSRRSFRRFIDGGQSTLRVVEMEGQTAGYVLIRFRRNSAIARLYSMAVADGFRGQGLGRALLAEAERVAIEEGCTHLRLEVRDGNAAARALYERAGYTLFAHYPDYYQDHADALRLEKRLTPGAGSHRSQLLAIIDRPEDWAPELPDLPRVSVHDYLRSPSYRNRRHLKLINLCDSYHYLGTGYYASLLAEARGHRVLPDVATITGLSSTALPRLDTAWLERRLQARLADEPTDNLSLTIAFGRCRDRRLREFARRLFESVRCPLLSVTLHREGAWRIQSIEPLAFSTLTDEDRTLMAEALPQWLGRRWQRPRDPAVYRYDLAILVDPDEAMPPSDAGALRRFVRAARQQALNVEFIDKRDFGRLAEFDALFIRATTRIDHFTYRFARRAALEGIAVIDDPRSILRCTNKVYLTELLDGHGVPQPATRIISRADWQDAPAALGWPVVLKIPDGAFSTGVFKAKDEAEYERLCDRLFHDSDLLLAQSWLYTQYDWRIGVLNGRPIYACQYFMSRNHWQIYRHQEGRGVTEGDSRTLAVEDAPPRVVETAVRAARLIGNGLYGVDLKENEDGVFVIEVNDNPNIDRGVEDVVRGQGLYDEIMAHFLALIESRHRSRDPAQSPTGDRSS